MDLRMSWVTFAIKTLPMLGLLGTVMGMVGAFANMGSGDKVDPARLAADISIALYTTAIGLGGAVPLMLISAMINIRTRKLEDRVTSGIIRLMDMLHPYLGKTGERKT
jgi:biopolymer transport protein ExbB